MALAAYRAANGGAGRCGDGNGRVGGRICYFVIHAVAWSVAELWRSRMAAPRIGSRLIPWGDRTLPVESSDGPINY